MNLLGMFAKYWAPGEVKSRLAAAIGNDRASELYRAFLETLLARFNSAANARVLAFAPADRWSDFQRLAGPSWRLEPQSNGNLGQRMADFFESAFHAGADRVVLIGSDSPTLPQSIVDAAFDALAQSPVVLGQNFDGGYYLIGATGRVPPVFEGIAWSTSTVFQQTVDRLDTAGIAYQVLPPWYDVDEAADLARLRDELGALHDADPALTDLQRRIEQIINRL